MRSIILNWLIISGAIDGIRTRDPQLGKLLEYTDIDLVNK